MPLLRGLIIVALFSSAALGQSADLALLGGTIYPSPADEPIRDGVVLISGGKIAAVGGRASLRVPPDVRTLNCTGFTIMAGFWNSHVHFFERKWANASTIPAPELSLQLQDMLTRYGFTSVFDLGSAWENTRAIRDRIESGEVSGPRIRTTGEPLLAPNAMPSELVFAIIGDMKFPVPEITDAAQASMAAKKLLNEGVDGIKVHLQPPPAPNPKFPESAIAAAVVEAHRAGKPVFVHPNSGEDVLAAVRSGVDIIAHTTPSSGPWDQTILTQMKEARVALIPTLQIWKSQMHHDRRSAQDKYVDTAVGQLRAWTGMGGTVLFGTDDGASDYDPSEEYALMSQAGMSFRQILTSLTTAPAERLGDAKQWGRVAAGLQADLVVVNGDPSRNIRALADVRYTVRAGKIIYRESQ